MKPLKCEMCSGTNFLKQDGLFVCQYCGVKYTVEEAKKMTIEGTVDVQGTVKVDNSDYIQKYLQNARRARDKEDWDEVEKYYNLVEQNDPTNVEAIFYSAYGKVKASLITDDIYKREATFKVLQNCVSLIDDNYIKEKEEEELAIIEQITVDIINLVCGNFVYHQKIDGYGNVKESDKVSTELLFVPLTDTYATSLKNIIDKYDISERHRIKTVYLMLIKIYELRRDHTWISVADKNLLNEKIVEAHTQIKNFEPDHAVPVFEKIEFSTGKGCYIATSVYGSYDCPEVWTLRRYRDYTLAETWYGRAFIKTYYAISPTLVKWFGHTQWFKKMWQGKLDRMVGKLQANGVESSPYEDKVW